METTPLPVARKAALQNRVIGLFPQKEAEVRIKKKKIDFQSLHSFSIKKISRKHCLSLNDLIA